MASEAKLVYTAEEVMRLLGLSKNSIYKAIRENSLPGVMRIGRRVIFSKQAMDKMLASGINPMATGDGDKGQG
jgi:excisionase family DNA binding protein